MTTEYAEQWRRLFSLLTIKDQHEVQQNPEGNTAKKLALGAVRATGRELRGAIVD